MTTAPAARRASAVRANVSATAGCRPPSADSASARSPILRPFTPDSRPVSASGTGVASDVASLGSTPAMTANARAASRTFRVSAPAWSNDDANAIRP